jgi:hypothetical protein
LAKNAHCEDEEAGKGAWYSTYIKNNNNNNLLESSWHVRNNW